VYDQKKVSLESTSAAALIIARGGYVDSGRSILSRRYWANTIPALAGLLVIYILPWSIQSQEAGDLQLVMSGFMPNYAVLKLKISIPFI